MKQLLSRRLGGFLLAASLLSSCQQDPSSANGPQSTRPLKASTPPANPAIAYCASTTAIGVMDTTGANATTLVTITSGTLTSPSWNYSAGSIAYSSIVSGTYAIKAVDVSVNAKGVPVASNARTIYSLAVSDSDRIQSGPAWCSSSSTGKIAFTRLHTDKANFGTTDLCTISQSGGTPNVLASFKKLSSTGAALGLYNSPTWSPDDSKIAVLRTDTTNHVTIMIFDASTGATVDSIPLPGAARNLEWSRTGMNELAYSYFTGSAYVISYVAASTGSTPTTNSVAGTFPTWSPNNSGILFLPASGADLKLVPFTTTTSSVGSAAFSYLNWKR